MFEGFTEVPNYRLKWEGGKGSGMVPGVGLEPT